MTTCYHIIALLPYPYYDLIVFIIFYLLPFLCAFILCHSFISSPHNECRSSSPRPVKCPHNECRSSGLRPVKCPHNECRSSGPRPVKCPHNECRSSGPRPVKCPHNECRSSGPRPVNFKVFIQNYVYKIKFKNLIRTSKLKFSFRGLKVVGLTNHRKS
jgi:hypothetical protein